jgi:catechol 2,3-dioxygenase-like lactoylglutathione lyase family enzyme
MALNGQPIVAFVGTTNPARARSFYAKTLGLTLISQDGFAIVFDAGGTMLRVTTVPTLQKAGYTVLGWTVADIRRAVTDLSRHGVTFRRYEGLEQDELGIWTAPSRAKVAWFEDPDGNTLSLTEMDEPPKRRAKPSSGKRPRSAKGRAGSPRPRS